MVRIRLALRGAKKKRFYCIVVSDSRSPRDGNFIEKVGCFNPINSDLRNNFFINYDRIQYWLKQGAQPSSRVASIIKKSKKFLK